MRRKPLAERTLKSLVYAAPFAAPLAYTGLGLLLLCVLKIVCVDVWGLDAQHRYLTLIILGAALLVVSFLYNRHREALRQLL